MLVGDSESGKTFLSLTCFAEASRNELFRRHRLIYDGPEFGALMDLDRFFGASTVARIEPPATDKDGRPLPSVTIEEFYDRLIGNLNAGPCLVVLDSQDALTSEAELRKAQENRRARSKIVLGGDAEVKGSYGDGKAKVHSSGLRQIIAPLQKHGSILVIISQTRDNVGNMFTFDKKTRSGGKAPKFYAAGEFWSSQAGEIRRPVRGKPRSLGIYSRIQVKKNRHTGRHTTVQVPIFWSHGIDDTGSLIDYLCDEGHWEGSFQKQTVAAPEFKFDGKRDVLAQQIEEAGDEQRLRLLAAEVWNDVERVCRVQRKKRYE